MSNHAPVVPDVTPHGKQAITSEVLHEQIRGAWADALGHNDFGDDTPFISAGGHSMKAARMFAKLSKCLGVRLPVRLAFEHQTISAQIIAIQRRISETVTTSE